MRNQRFRFVSACSASSASFGFVRGTWITLVILFETRKVGIIIITTSYQICFRSRNSVQVLCLSIQVNAFFFYFIFPFCVSFLQADPFYLGYEVSHCVQITEDEFSFYTKLYFYYCEYLKSILYLLLFLLLYMLHMLHSHTSTFEKINYFSSSRHHWTIMWSRCHINGFICRNLILNYHRLRNYN